MPWLPNTDVVVAHDYLTQRGGAERVALTIADCVAPKALITSLYDPAQTYGGFRRHPVSTSYLQHFGLFRRDPRLAVALLSSAWSRFDPIDADLVIASSSGWAHGVPVTPRTTKIVYCHNPPRWIYQAHDYARELGTLGRITMRGFAPHLRKWDASAARTADVYVANSSSVADRIRAAYGIEPVTIFPPVSLDADGAMEEVTDLPDTFFLTVARARGYKGTQRLVEAFETVPNRNLVIVGQYPDTTLPTNVTSVGYVTDAELRWLYRSAIALVSVSREDFGLTPIEANAMGTPSLVLRAGGFLDSTSEGVSGKFIESDSIEDIRTALISFDHNWSESLITAHAAKFSVSSFMRNMAEVARSVSRK